MSFVRNPILGLVYDWTIGGQLIHEVVTKDTIASFICITASGLSHSCVMVTGGTTDTSADPRDSVRPDIGQPLGVDADYYAIGVRFAGPRLAGGHLDCGPLPASECAGPTQAMYEGGLSGSYLMIEDFPNGPYAPPSTFEGNLPSGGGPGAITFTDWPWDYTDPLHSPPFSDNDLAYIVNPDPVWPFPDAEGNTFGQCLFTYAQIPTIDLSMIWGTSNTESGFLHITVLPYWEEASAPEMPYWMDVL